MSLFFVEQVEKQIIPVQQFLFPSPTPQVIARIGQDLAKLYPSLSPYFAYLVRNFQLSHVATIWQTAGQVRLDRLEKLTFKPSLTIPFDFEAIRQNPQAGMFTYEADVLLYQAEHIFGFGCNIYNPYAYERILELKKRSRNKGFIALQTNKSFVRLSSLDHARLADLTYNSADYFELEANADKPKLVHDGEKSATSPAQAKTAEAKSTEAKSTEAKSAQTSGQGLTRTQNLRQLIYLILAKRTEVLRVVYTLDPQLFPKFVHYLRKTWSRGVLEVTARQDYQDLHFVEQRAVDFFYLASTVLNCYRRVELLAENLGSTEKLHPNTKAAKLYKACQQVLGDNFFTRLNKANLYTLGTEWAELTAELQKLLTQFPEPAKPAKATKAKPAAVAQEKAQTKPAPADAAEVSEADVQALFPAHLPPQTLGQGLDILLTTWLADPLLPITTLVPANPLPEHRADFVRGARDSSIRAKLLDDWVNSISWREPMRLLLDVDEKLNRLANLPEEFFSILNMAIPNYPNLLLTQTPLETNTRTIPFGLEEQLENFLPYIDSIEPETQQLACPPTLYANFNTVAVRFVTNPQLADFLDNHLLSCSISTSANLSGSKIEFHEPEKALWYFADELDEADDILELGTKRKQKALNAAQDALALVKRKLKAWEKANPALGNLAKQANNQAQKNKPTHKVSHKVNQAQKNHQAQPEATHAVMPEQLAQMLTLTTELAQAEKALEDVKQQDFSDVSRFDKWLEDEQYREVFAEKYRELYEQAHRLEPQLEQQAEKHSITQATAPATQGVKQKTAVLADEETVSVSFADLVAFRKQKYQDRIAKARETAKEEAKLKRKKKSLPAARKSLTAVQKLTSQQADVRLLGDTWMFANSDLYAHKGASMIFDLVEFKLVRAPS